MIQKKKKRLGYFSPNRGQQLLRGEIDSSILGPQIFIGMKIKISKYGHICHQKTPNVALIIFCGMKYLGNQY